MAGSCFYQLSSAYANNATVANVAFGNRYGEDGYMQIQFDLSWDNSWRNSVNRDAVWIFVKYKVTSNGTWNHCTLKVITPDVSGYTINPTNYSVGTEASSQTPRIVVPSDKKGCFVERASSGHGTMNITGTKILWDWATDSLTKTSTIYQIKVFAVEMAYIPQGSFYAGDGATASIVGNFENANTGSAKLITSEDALTLGGGGAGSLGNNNSNGMSVNYYDDFDSVSTSQTLPAAFPKGYKAFYLMKYEITEGSWVDFVNTLTATQQSHRDITDATGKSSNLTVYRNTVSWDGTNFATTRPDRGCGYLSWPDGCAFADWAALRPMSELEYEKACRGPSVAVAGEYAWGSTARTTASTISGAEDGTEVITTAGANVSRGGVFSGGDADGPGALRAGIFATSTSTRQSAGAGYYGVMELTGNLTERVNSVSDPPGWGGGRGFTGTHGDGVLNSYGFANNTDWAGIGWTAHGGVDNNSGSGLRGNTVLTVSNRLTYIAVLNSWRGFNNGFRCARTGPSS